jgi:hypothetical protein
MEGSPPRQSSPSRRRRGLSPPLRVQSRVAEQGDCKGTLSVLSIMETLQLAKTATQYLEDSTSWALRLRVCRWPFGTGGRAPVNSTLWSEELSRHGSFTRRRVHAFGGLAAALNRSKASRFGGNGGSRA